MASACGLAAAACQARLEWQWVELYESSTVALLRKQSSDLCRPLGEGRSCWWVVGLVVALHSSPGEQADRWWPEISATDVFLCPSRHALLRMRLLHRTAHPTKCNHGE